MVPWWKRLAYGLFGWVVATCVIGVFVSIWLVAHLPAGRGFSVSRFADVWLLFLISALAVSVGGWLLGIPFVLVVKNTIGRRFWIYLALGSCIRPGLFFGELLYSVQKHSASGGVATESTDYSTLWMSAVVSGLTTLVYLLLLRRAQLAQKSN
jgi:hypothetical protein